MFATFGQKQKKTPQTGHSVESFGAFVCFCFLEVFATFGQKQKKTRENQKKKNSTDYVGPRGSHRAIVSRVLVLLCVFLFSRGFFLVFGQKKQKNRENFFKKTRPHRLFGAKG